MIEVLPELGRLDPWSFWVAPGEDFGADLVVIGVTGGFAIWVNHEEGYLRAGLRGIRIGGDPVTSVRGMRSAARKLKSKLSSLTAYTDVEPILCCTRANVGTPKRFKGVWLAKPADAVKLMARRSNVLQRPTAKRAAQALGAKVSSVRRDQDGE